MRSPLSPLVFALALLPLLMLPTPGPRAWADSPDAPTTIGSFVPNYVPIPELLSLLGAHEVDGRLRADIDRGGRTASIEVRPLDTANRLVLIGAREDLDAALTLMRALDMAPRQIEIEATILEVNRTKARDLGIDWEGMWSGSGTRVAASYDGQDNDASTDRSITLSNENTRTASTAHRLSAQSSVDLSRYVKLFDETGIGRIRNTPRIITLNNRPATIMDGQRVTYVSRASAYANIYETQTMDTGLKLEVLPALGESGLLSLHIKAELTQLATREISGSPIKDGQMIENVVIARNGEPIRLGGFQRRVDVHRHKRFPLLGTILPFLFSREVVDEQVWDSYIVLTAHIVDYDTRPDARMQKELDVPIPAGEEKR